MQIISNSNNLVILLIIIYILIQHIFIVQLIQILLCNDEKAVVFLRHLHDVRQQRYNGACINFYITKTEEPANKDQLILIANIQQLVRYPLVGIIGPVKLPDTKT